MAKPKRFIQQPSSAPVSKIIADLKAAYAKCTGGLLTKITEYAEFGKLWNQAVREVVPQSGQTIEQWALTQIDVSYQFANRCGFLARNYSEFTEAHQWYQQSGIAAGFRTKRNSGVDYANDVIKLHRLHKAGKGPNNALLPVKKKETVRQNLDAAIQKNAVLQVQTNKYVAELVRVVGLYRCTEAGQDFESQVLNVALSTSGSMDIDERPISLPLVSSIRDLPVQRDDADTIEEESI